MLGYFYWAVKFIWMEGPLSRNENFRLKLGQLVDIKSFNNDGYLFHYHTIKEVKNVRGLYSKTPQR